jgi:adenylate kinase
LNILLFGPPGAGKGTQSAFLVERLKMRHISTGDLFRAAIKNKTALGIEANGYIAQGKLVPDTVTINMVDEVLRKLGGASFILDGFPRNVIQAEALEELLSQLKLRLDRAVFLEVPREELVRRLSGRRVCRSCGAVYHIEGRPLKDGKTCDNCGGTDIYQRDDDRAEAVETRLRVYDESTKPLKEYYGKTGKLVEVLGSGEVESVFAKVEKAVRP